MKPSTHGIGEREIKFRAWDKTEETMRQVDFCLELVFGTKKRLFVVNNCTSDGLETHDHLSEYVVMQYTGLKDKNGKEIYEGDILSHPDDGTFFFKFDGCELYPSWIGEDYCDDSMRDLWRSCKFEIIGNVFENPELLE